MKDFSAESEGTLNLLRIEPQPTLLVLIPKRYKSKSPSFGWTFTSRRVSDSNPRTCDSQRFSRPPHSTTLPTLRDKSTNFLFHAKVYFRFLISPERRFQRGRKTTCKTQNISLMCK